MIIALSRCGWRTKILGRHRPFADLATPGRIVRAGYVTEYGPASIQVHEQSVSLPNHPPSDCIRVRVAAASVNQLDVMMSQGYGRSLFEALRPQQFPFIPGLDCAGTVKEIGKSVYQFKPGDRVMGIYSPVHHGGHGTFADLVDIPVAMAAHIPDHLSNFRASAIPFAAMTAASAIPSAHIPRAVVLGGSGGVGLFALQILKSRGAYVAVTCSSNNRHICLNSGADLALDYEKDDIEAQIESESIDLVIDCSGQARDLTSSRQPLKYMRPGSAYHTLSSPFIKICDQTGNPLIGMAKAYSELSQTKIRTWAARRIHYNWSFFRPNPCVWQQVITWSQDKVLRPVVSRVLPLEKLSDAFIMMETAHLPGKIVIDMMS
uniref:Enoyl reductase (ER) domain-containing protein n=1 Tax=Spongospora subterranea TaxID=70186 RepID=A0A0H5R5Z0_9EUKA|eukprot:CRZ09276.1 hypothetical protein [Spongospora subterranea]